MRIVCCTLLLAAAAGTGCLTLPDGWQMTKAGKPPAPTAVRPASPPVPVKPGQVTETNAYQMAEQLDAELEWEQTAPPATGERTRVRDDVP